MKLSELKTRIDSILSRKDEDPEVVVRIKLPYASIGGTPSMEVESVHLGFDWDRGKFFIQPKESLTLHDKDFAKIMMEWQEKCDWLTMQNRALEKELKKLKSQ